MPINERALINRVTDLAKIYDGFPAMLENELFKEVNAHKVGRKEKRQILITYIVAYWRSYHENTAVYHFGTRKQAKHVRDQVEELVKTYIEYATKDKDRFPWDNALELGLMLDTVINALWEWTVKRPLEEFQALLLQNSTFIPAHKFIRRPAE